MPTTPHSTSSRSRLRSSRTIHRGLETLRRVREVSRRWNQPLGERRKEWLRWRIAIRALAGLLLAAIGVVFWQYYDIVSDPQKQQAAIREALAEIFKTVRVELDEPDVDFLDHNLIRIPNLALHQDPLLAGGQIIAASREITVRVAPGTWKVEEITLNRPTLRLTRDARGAWNYESLLPEPSASGSGSGSGSDPEAGPAPTIPTIAIVDGRMALSDPRWLDDDQAFEVGPISLRVDPPDADGVSAIYALVEAPHIGMMRVRATYQFEKRTFELHADSVRPTTVRALDRLARILTPGGREVWDALDLRQGNAYVSVHARLVAGEPEHISVQVRLEDVALSPTLGDGAIAVEGLAGTVAWRNGRVWTPEPVHFSALGAHWQLDANGRRVLLAPDEPLELDEATVATLARLSDAPLDELGLRGQLSLRGVLPLPDTFEGPWAPRAELAGGWVSIEGLPRATGLRGTLAGKDAEFSAQFAGSPTRIRLQLGDEVALDVAAPGIAIDPEWRPPLPDAWRERWAALGLRGTLDAYCRFVWRGETLRHQHRVGLRDASLTVEETKIAGLKTQVRVTIDDTGARIAIDPSSAQALGGTLSLRNAELRAATPGELETGAIALACGFDRITLAKLAALVPEEHVERWQRWQPSGVVGAQLLLGGTLDAPKLVGGRLTLRDARATPPELRGHPVLVPRLDARLTDGQVLIERSEVRVGRSRALVSGQASLASIRAGAPEGEVRVVLDALHVGESWIAEVLPRAIVEEDIVELRPEGEVRGLLRIPLEGEAGIGKPAGTLRARNGSLRLLEFDERLSHICAEVRVDGRQIEIAQAAGRLGTRPFFGGGTIFAGETGQTRMDLRFAAASLPVTEWLRQSLDAEYRGIIREFALRGTLDIEVALSRVPGERTLARIILLPRGDLSLAYEDFPVRVGGIVGRVEISRYGVLIPHLRGRIGKGRIEATGEIEAGGPYNPIRLDIRGRGIPLDPRLRASLPTRYQRIWDLLGPTGVADVNVQLRRKDRDDRRHHQLLVVQPRAVALRIGGTPVPWTWTGGELRINPSRVRLAGLRALAGARGEVRIDGSIWENDRPLDPQQVLALPLGSGGMTRDLPVDRRLRLTLRAREVPIESRMIALLGSLSEDLGEALKPGGHVRSLVLTVDGHDGRRRTIAHDLDLRLAGGTLSLGGHALERTDARIRLAGRRDGEIDVVRGRVEELSATLFGGPLRDASLAIRWAGETLTLSQIRGRYASGPLAARLNMTTGERGSFDGRLRLDRADLAQLDTGDQQLAGRMSLGVEVAGSSKADMTGRGAVTVDEGKLWKLPLLLRILDVFELQKPGTIEHAGAAFRIRGGALHFDRVQLRSPGVLDLDGKGRIGFDGAVSGALTTKFAPETIPHLPIVSRLWRELKRNVIPIRIAGTLESPSVTLGPLELISKDR